MLFCQHDLKGNYAVCHPLLVIRYNVVYVLTTLYQYFFFEPQQNKQKKTRPVAIVFIYCCVEYIKLLYYVFECNMIVITTEAN